MKINLFNKIKTFLKGKNESPKSTVDKPTFISKYKGKDKSSYLKNKALANSQAKTRMHMGTDREDVSSKYRNPNTISDSSLNKSIDSIKMRSRNRAYSFIGNNLAIKITEP